MHGLLFAFPTALEQFAKEKPQGGHQIPDRKAGDFDRVAGALDLDTLDTDFSGQWLPPLAKPVPGGQFRRVGRNHVDPTAHSGHLLGQVPQVLFGATDHVASKSVNEEENTHSAVILGQEDGRVQEKSNRREIESRTAPLSLSSFFRAAREFPKRRHKGSDAGRVGLDFACGRCVG